MTFLLKSMEIAEEEDSLEFQDSSEEASHPCSTGGTKTSYFGNKHEDEYDIMAKPRAMQIRKLAPDQKFYARKIINDVLFEGSRGTLTSNGVLNKGPQNSIQTTNNSNLIQPEGLMPDSDIEA
ncbi:unnamed protein product [Parnassius mnemosyne]|uniref:Uncharacterized protein n=1 Tax=Parnassius mnemosyne TaxID=213953 RepID=A0AAV1L4L3_9NEOP